MKQTAKTKDRKDFIMKEKDEYIWYYKQIEENDRNIKRNLEHISNGEPKEKLAFIVPEKERYFDSIRVCKVPELYSNFKINPDYDFVITFKHLYTMQCPEEAGFYPHSYDTNYHNMGIELLNELPDLIETAFIEPNMGSEKATVILSSYPKEQYERFLEKNIKQGGLLYLKNKEALRRDSPVVNATRIATVSFNGLLYINKIARFNENVNLKRVQNNGMALIVFTENMNGEVYYDQSLSSIEKGKLIDIIQQKNKPEAFNPINHRDSNELYQSEN